MNQQVTNNQSELPKLTEAQKERCDKIWKSSDRIRDILELCMREGIAIGRAESASPERAPDRVRQEAQGNCQCDFLGTHACPIHATKGQQ